MDKIIRKYFLDSISTSELNLLLEWLKNEENEKMFKGYARECYDLDLALQEVDVDYEYQILINKIRYKKSFYQKWGKWAAVFVGIIGLSWVFMLNDSTPKTNIDNNAITLKLDNGDIKIVSEDGNERILNKKGEIVSVKEGDELNYNKLSDKQNSEKLVFNELNIPYGKKMKIVLSDGSLVHLNAGSTLKYPVKFLNGMERKVFLSGEAYFDIAKDKLHTFVVNTQNINVQALGTKFNVNSYKEDSEISTALVEGSVGVYNVDEKFDAKASTVLMPGYKASWNKSENRMNINEVDIEEHIAWTKGQLLFKSKSFTDIIKVLERTYDVTIINNYQFLNEERFIAKFDTETIEQILISFQNSEKFSYKINGNKITIDKPN